MPGADNTGNVEQSIRNQSPESVMSLFTDQEPLENLSAPMLDMHRAISTLGEALHALDVANQRQEACTDPELRLLLAHQRDAGKRKIAMLLEWMRRRDVRLDIELKEALFKAGPIIAQYHYPE
jgi:hypothetical protein